MPATILGHPPHMKPRRPAHCTAAGWVGALALACAGTLPGTALAQGRTPGEIWRVSSSGTGLGPGLGAGPAPAGAAMEVCLPKENPEDALSLPPQDEDTVCRVLNGTRAGNRSTGRIECKDGGETMRGTFDITSEPGRIRSTVTIEGMGLRMTLRNDAVRVGTPCTVGQAPR